MELLGACFPAVRRGKFHMALAWDRARLCLSGQKEGAVCIPPARQPSPMHKSRLVDISIRLITGSGRLWETPSGWRSPASTQAGGMAVSTGPGCCCQSLMLGKLNPGSDMPTGEDWGSRFLTLRRVHIALAGVLEIGGPCLPIPQCGLRAE